MKVHQNGSSLELIISSKGKLGLVEVLCQIAESKMNLGFSVSRSLSTIQKAYRLSSRIHPNVFSLKPHNGHKLFSNVVNFGVIVLRVSLWKFECVRWQLIRFLSTLPAELYGCEYLMECSFFLSVIIAKREWIHKKSALFAHLEAILVISLQKIFQILLPVASLVFRDSKHSVWILND